MKPSKGFQFTFLAAFFWAISIIITRIILKGEENAYNVAFWIIVLSTPYWLFIFLKHLGEFKAVIKKNYWIFLLMGLVSGFAINIVEPFALKYSSAVNFSLLIRSTLFFTILFAYIFLGEKITFKKIIIAILILLGSFLLITGGNSISLSKGDIFTLFEAALISFGNTILGKIAVKRMSTNLSASVSSLLAILPIALIAKFNNAIAIPKYPLLMIILSLAVILLIISRFRAYQYATASYIGMVFSFTPVFVSLLAIPLLGESISPIQLIGGGLIIFGGIAVEKVKI